MVPETPDLFSDHKKFMKLLVTAGMAMNDPHYFAVEFPSSDGSRLSNELRYRERVYCYELYHRIRTILESESDYSNFSLIYKLDGEYDKSGYPAPTLKRRKPDFIVHKPGCNINNLAVVEVKPLKNGVDLKKDMNSLKSFVRSKSLHYHWGIMLLYGSQGDVNEFIDQFNFYKNRCNNLSLMWHQSPNAPPTLISGYNPSI